MMYDYNQFVIIIIIMSIEQLIYENERLNRRIDTLEEINYNLLSRIDNNEQQMIILQTHIIDLKESFKNQLKQNILKPTEQIISKPIEQNIKQFELFNIETFNQFTEDNDIIDYLRKCNLNERHNELYPLHEICMYSSLKHFKLALNINERIVECLNQKTNTHQNNLLTVTFLSRIDVNEKAKHMLDLYVENKFKLDDANIHNNISLHYLCSNYNVNVETLKYSYEKYVETNSNFNHLNKNGKLPIQFINYDMWTSDLLEFMFQIHYDKNADCTILLEIICKKSTVENIKLLLDKFTEKNIDVPKNNNKIPSFDIFYNRSDNVINEKLFTLYTTKDVIDKCVTSTGFNFSNYCTEELFREIVNICVDNNLSLK